MCSWGVQHRLGCMDCAGPQLQRMLLPRAVCKSERPLQVVNYNPRHPLASSLASPPGDAHAQSRARSRRPPRCATRLRAARRGGCQLWCPVAAALRVLDRRRQRAEVHAVARAAHHARPRRRADARQRATGGSEQHGCRVTLLESAESALRSTAAAAPAGAAAWCGGSGRPCTRAQAGHSQAGSQLLRKSEHRAASCIKNAQEPLSGCRSRAGSWPARRSPRSVKREYAAPPPRGQILCPLTCPLCGRACALAQACLQTRRRPQRARPGPRPGRSPQHLAAPGPQLGRSPQHLASVQSLDSARHWPAVSL